MATLGDDEYYGIRILDDAHTIFPELLYDTRMFPDTAHSVLAWMRFRIRMMMPQAYAHAKNQYDRQFSQQARSEYNEWIYRFSRIDSESPLPPPIRRRMQQSRPAHYATTIAATANTIIDPLDSNPLLTALQELIIPIPRTILFDETHIAHDNFLRRFFEIVPINPSQEQIATGSSILTHDAVGTDVICSVCQEHDCWMHPNEPWRKLNHCEHLFHQLCIDSWLERSPFCPVCRSDIRGPTPTIETHRQPGPSSSESSPTS